MVDIGSALWLGISLISLGNAQPAQTPDTVVVEGQRIRDYGAELQACLARNCPPDEDVDATMALAESLFMEGDYGEARAAIRASIRRNRDEAARYPEPVADLYRANARVARHLGLDRDAAMSMRQTLRALRAGLPTEDHRHFTARLEIAQSLVAFGQYEAATQELGRLIELAQAAGRDDVAAAAELRRLWVSYLQYPTGPALRRLIAISQSRDPANRALAVGARSLLVRIYSERGDTTRADALIRELSRDAGGRRLLYAPLYELAQIEDVRMVNSRAEEIGNNVTGGGRPMLPSSLSYQLVDSFDDKWIDVSFWITPEGRVEDLTVARQGEGGAGWADPLLESISGRRYTASQDGERTFRLERYTYTSEFGGAATGSRIPQRSPRARVEYLDLSTSEPSNSREGLP